MGTDTKRILIMQDGEPTLLRELAGLQNGEKLELVVCDQETGWSTQYDNVDLALLDADGNRETVGHRLVTLCGAGHQPKIALLTSDFSGINVARLAKCCDLVLPKPLDAATLACVLEWLAFRVDPLGNFARDYRLSPRESLLVDLFLSGRNNDEIASHLGCTRSTISTYWNRVFRKMGVSGQREVLLLLFHRIRPRP